MTCPCGAQLSPDNITGECAECRWWRINGGERTDEVDERQGLANVVNIMFAVERLPTVTLSRADTGRYLVEFLYNRRLVDLLKATVPSPMRKWYSTAKCWDVSAEWAGPLLGALRNAGVQVTGLNESEEAQLFGWCAEPARINKKGQVAYAQGLCTTCTRQPHRPGGVECVDCYDARMARVHRVSTALAAKGLTPYPSAAPSKGGAIHCRVPLRDDVDDIAAPEVIDYSAVADVEIVAASESCAPKCAICDRKPANDAIVHAGCRQRLLHLLSERPFTKARNAAYQADLCTVCLSRPHLPRTITCGHCAALRHRVEDRSRMR